VNITNVSTDRGLHICQEQTLQRIAIVMSTGIDDVVKPVKEFVAETLQKPLILHQVPRVSLESLSNLVKCAEKKPGGRVDLTDILATVKDALDAHLPFPWVAFASDVGVAFAQTGHFVENTHEAGGGTLCFCSCRCCCFQLQVDGSNEFCLWLQCCSMLPGRAMAMI